MRLLSRLFALSLLAASTVGAQTISTATGTRYNTSGPIEDNVTVDRMAGVTVVATWSNGFSQSYTMGAFGLANALMGVSNANLTFSTLNGFDAFISLWTVTNRRSAALTRLVIDAANTSLVFDRTLPNNAVGTPGSNVGASVTACLAILCLNDAWNTNVLYTDAVGVNGAAPVGDLFRRIEIDFGNGGISSQFGRAALLRFDADASLGPVTATPEPSTYALMGAGLLAMFAVARRRRVA